MKIAAGTWQQDKKSVYKADQQQNKKGVDSADQQQGDKEAIPVYAKKATQHTPWANPAGAAQKQTASASGNGGKIKASMPDDQVGQLASELANSETKFDVQNVSSKAMRALANLRMAGALSEGEDKKKIAQMVAETRPHKDETFSQGRTARKPKETGGGEEERTGDTGSAR